MPGGKVHIIGVAPAGITSLSPEASDLLRNAEMVFGGRRLLEMLPELSAQKLVIGNNLEEVARLVRENYEERRIVVLASGDPGFYGIARYLTGELGRDLIEIIPNVSAVQLAFARIKESWDDAAVVSAHSRPVGDILETVRRSRKTGILTDKKNTPGEIARVLLESGIENCRAYVCEDLGSENERITAADLNNLRDGEFSPLNIMILIRDGLPGEVSAQRCFGILDSEFRQRRDGLITKLEVRAVSLAKMRLNQDSVVWDIGAGSGAVSVEAAYLAVKGNIFAVERNAQSITDIRENIRKFGVNNVTVIGTEAPEGLAGLPDPSVVFIGGSGGRLAEIMREACARLKPRGRIVINAATLETLHAATDAFQQNRFISEIISVNIARSEDVAGLTHFQSLNPVFVIAGWREGENH